MTLVPTLTRVDRRVLDYLYEDYGQRAAEIARRARMDPAETRLILRGLEAIGSAQQRGGWWTRRST